MRKFIKTIKKRVEEPNSNNLNTTMAIYGWNVMDSKA